MTKLLILFIIVPSLAIVFLILNLLLAPSKPDEAKTSVYECGFETIQGQTRSIFHIHFYIVGLLFLIFDLEVLLLFPIAVTLSHVGIYGFTVALIFLLILTIGFILEIGSGSISLDKLMVVKNKYKDFTNKLNNINTNFFKNINLQGWKNSINKIKPSLSTIGYMPALFPCMSLKGLLSTTRIPTVPAQPLDLPIIVNVVTEVQVTTEVVATFTMPGSASASATAVVLPSTVEMVATAVAPHVESICYATSFLN